MGRACACLCSYGAGVPGRMRVAALGSSFASYISVSHSFNRKASAVRLMSGLMWALASRCDALFHENLVLTQHIFYPG